MRRRLVQNVRVANLLRPSFADAIGYVLWGSLYRPIYSIAATIYVATTGNDTTGNGSSGAPYATLNKALSVATAGSVIELAAGTYIEDRAALGYSTVSWESPISASYAFASSGTLGSPIIIRPAFLATVILDGASTRAGIHVQRNNHVFIYGIQFQNFETMAIGCSGNYNIGTVGTSSCNVIDRSQLSRFVTVDSCTISAVRGSTTNEQGIAPWGSGDWTIRNCSITDVQQDDGTRGAGVRWYGAENLTIDHCYIFVTGTASVGVHGKDHYVENSGGAPVHEATIRYSHIRGLRAGILCSIRGSGYRRAGTYNVHHNILRGDTDSDHAVVAMQMYGGQERSGQILITHNIIDGSGGANSVGVNGISFDDIQMQGNIIVGCSFGEMSLENDEAQIPLKQTILTEFDYNIVPDSGLALILDRYHASGATITSLATFEALVTNDYFCIGADIGDNNITSNTTALFTDYATQDYSHSVGSPALALMADGSNAGPYQTGSEVIGVIS